MDFRQDILPKQRPDYNRSEKYAMLFHGFVRDVDFERGAVVVDAEEVGVLRRARLAHRALSHDAGSVKFPAKLKTGDNPREIRDAANCVLMPIFDKIEDSVILGFVDIRGDSVLIEEIAEYVKANPKHEYPWLDVHPAGQRVFQDGFGSYYLESHAFDPDNPDAEVSDENTNKLHLVSEAGKEVVLLETAKDTPLTLRAVGNGKVTLESVEGEIEIKTDGATITISKDGQVTVNADGAVAITAGDNVTVEADGNIELSASEIKAIASTVKAGLESSVKRLVNDTLETAFNTHVHSGVQTGSGSTAPPTTPLPQSVFTKNLKGS